MNAMMRSRTVKSMSHLGCYSTAHGEDCARAGSGTLGPFAEALSFLLTITKASTFGVKEKKSWVLLYSFQSEDLLSSGRPC